MTKSISDIIETLESFYGPATWITLKDPVDELIACVLTQHSSDIIAIPAFKRIKENYKDWDDLVKKGPEPLIEIIRNTGLANQKSRTIIRSLEFIKEQLGEYSLKHLDDMSLLEARKWLMQIPGVGPKTASIVLCFAMGRDAIPVDTHVHRVCKRIGFIPSKSTANLAHDLLLEIVPQKWAYRFHVALIQHGRTICKALKPQCGKCMIKEQCDWYADHKESATTTSLQK